MKVGKSFISTQCRSLPTQDWPGVVPLHLLRRKGLAARTRALLQGLLTECTFTRESLNRLGRTTNPGCASRGQAETVEYVLWSRASLKSSASRSFQLSPSGTSSLHHNHAGPVIFVKNLKTGALAFCFTLGLPSQIRPGRSPVTACTIDVNLFQAFGDVFMSVP